MTTLSKHVGVENLERINKIFTTSLSICLSFCKLYYKMLGSTIKIQPLRLWERGAANDVSSTTNFMHMTHLDPVNNVWRTSIAKVTPDLPEKRSIRFNPHFTLELLNKSLLSLSFVTCIGSSAHVYIIRNSRLMHEEKTSYGESKPTTNCTSWKNIKI
jgi:hypothetical protein